MKTNNTTVIEATTTEETTKIELTDDQKTELRNKFMTELRDRVKSEGFEGQIEIVEVREKSGTKDVYTVKLSNDETVEFKSADDGAAKYRAYRIGRDGTKTRPSGLKVVSLTGPDGQIVK